MSLFPAKAAGRSATDALIFHQLQNVLSPLGQRHAALDGAGVVGGGMVILQGLVIVQGDETLFLQALQQKLFSRLLREWGGDLGKH